MEPFNQSLEDIPPRQQLLDHQAQQKPFKFEKKMDLRDYKIPKPKAEAPSYDKLIAQEIVKSKNSHLERELRDLIYQTVEKPL